MTVLQRVELVVNGRPVAAEVPPRTHLGDFLRDSAHLTGTHLSCEHGVCGACTVLLDGQPARSCITFAVACESRQVTTIEGYDGDPVMARLRRAFTERHALQCGFCTPGMLATARDIVLRLPEADEARVRLELAGNLCRCTGYVGIVAAIRDVLGQLQTSPDPAVEALRRALIAGPAAAQAAASPSTAFATFEAASGSTTATNSATTSATTSAASASASTTDATAAAASIASAAPAPATSAKPMAGGTRIDGSFELPHPAAEVWAFMGDLKAVAACLPGAQVESEEGDKVRGRIAIRFGPMSAAFAGAAKLERDDAAMRAMLRGAGQDSLSQSRAQGDVGYRIEALSPTTCRVLVDLTYTLQGPLAQFSRSGLVKDFVRRMIADFGRNVGAQLTARAGGPASGAGGTSPTATGAGAAPMPAAPAPASISLLAVLGGMLRDRIRRWFSKS